MQEDLQMYGNQLVTSTSIYTVGYVIGQIPSNLLLTRVSPRWVIPTVHTSSNSSRSTAPDLLTLKVKLEVGWGIATFATASVNSNEALYAVRFFVGLFE